MKTLKDMIPSLFSSYSNNISDITVRLSKLSNVTSYGSTFKNCLQVSKLVTAEADAAKLSMNTFDWVDQMLDVDWIGIDGSRLRFNQASDAYDSDLIWTGAHKLGELVNWNYDNDPVDDNIVGYYSGAPIYLYVGKNVSDDNIRILMSNMPYSNDNWFAFLDLILWKDTEDDVEHTYGSLYCNKNSETFECWIGKNIKDGETVTWDPRYASATVEQLLSSMCNTFITNECYSNVIARAQTDGAITVAQIKDITSHYATTDGINELTSLIAGMDSLSSVSVITLIGKLMSEANGSYDEGSDCYQLYSDPGYINSIIQAVVTILVSIVAVILSVLFKAIAAIVTVVTTLLSHILSLVQDNLPKTEVTIDELSLTPVINYQLATFDITSEHVTNGFYNITFDELMQEVNDSGCAALALPTAGQSPGILWILPKNETTLTVQILINGTLPHISTTGWAENNPIPWSDVNDSSYLHCAFSIDPDIEPIYETADDIEYEYISYTDMNVRRALAINSMLFLQYCLLGTNPANIPAGTVGVNAAGWEKNDDPHQIDFSKVGLSTLISRVGELPNQDDFDKIARIVGLFAYPTAFLIARANYDVPSWSALKTWFDTCNSCSLAIREMAFPTWYNRGPYMKYMYNDLSSGVTLAKPAMKWPDLNKSSLLRAILLTGLATVAMAGIAIGLKVGMKRVAFDKLSSRTEQFETAKKEYEEYKANYKKYGEGYFTKQGLTKLQKTYRVANRKLTKAWNFAGKFGLSMYNGFSTGSTSGDSAPATNPMSSSSDLYTKIFDMSEVNSSDQVDQAISVNDLLTAITGHGGIG